MLISTAVLLDSIIRNSVCTPAKLPCRRVEVGYEEIKNIKNLNLLHSLGLVYKSMRGMMTNSIDRDQCLNVTSESRDRIWPFFFF
jgi:hypothetical protein